MIRTALGNTGLDTAPIILGGNVFGWTLDEKGSFEVLDAFLDHGFNAIDTADCYSAWVAGNVGGESETIIGNWLKARPGARDKVAIFTKVGSVDGGPHPHGLSERWIIGAVEKSLRRLNVEQIDIYFAHWPDPAGTSSQETLGAFQKLMREGKIKAIGASNMDASQLDDALSTAERENLPGYAVLQPEYNLYDRSSFEGNLRDLCSSRGIAVVTYFSLASGFLSGKYRSIRDFSKSTRGGGMEKYLNPRGERILSALDEVSSTHGAKPAEVALAWLLAREGVTAPIASATSINHVESFVRAASLKLSAQEVAALTAAGSTRMEAH